MSLLIPLIYFILANGLLVLLSKKSFGKCIPITLMITAIILYISQYLFKTFTIGTIINILIPIAFLILLFIKYKKNDLKVFNKNFFTIGLYSFILLYIGVYIFDLYRVFTKWDEFSHWGVMIKEMFRLDRFYSIKSSTLMVHKDYPPIVQLFELFYAKLSGGYKEAYLIRAIHLFNLSLFIPVISETYVKKTQKYKTIIKIILIIISVYLIILLFDGHNIINSIYIDYTMAIVTAYLLGIIVFEKDLLNKFTLINLSIGLSFLLLIKQMSIPLYLMILFMFIVSIIIKKEKSITKESIPKIVKVILLLVVIPFLTLKSWNSYVDKLNVEKQFELKDLKITELKDIVSGNKGEKYQQEASTNYLNAIKKENITTSYLKINYIQWLIITIVLLYILWSQNKEYFHKHQILLIMATLTLGYIGYFLVMLIMYVFSFGPYEGPNLASFDRYMSTYVLISILLTFMIFINIYVNNKNSLSKLIILTILLILIQSPFSINKCFPKIIKPKNNGFIEMAKIINKNTKKNSKIYIIAQNSSGDYQFYIKYYLDDKTTNLEYFDLPILENNNCEEYFNTNVKDYMYKYDYLYLAKIDESFKEKYNFIFDNNIKEGNLYKINKSNIELIYENN